MHVLPTIPPFKLPDQLIVYTDGGCSPNPGLGGWAYVIKDTTLITLSEHFGAEPQTTNNRMELTAAIRALQHLQRRHSLELRSDSNYLIKIMTEWLPKWQQKGWKTTSGPVQNLDLIQTLHGLAQQHTITWKWVKAHNTDSGNERADALVREARAIVDDGRTMQTLTHPKQIHSRSANDITLTPKLLMRLKEEANKNHCSIDWIIETICEEYFNKK